MVPEDCKRHASKDDYLQRRVMQSSISFQSEPITAWFSTVLFRLPTQQVDCTSAGMYPEVVHLQRTNECFQVTYLFVPIPKPGKIPVLERSRGSCCPKFTVKGYPRRPEVMWVPTQCHFPATKAPLQNFGIQDSDPADSPDP